MAIAWLGTDDIFNQGGIQFNRDDHYNDYDDGDDDYVDEQANFVRRWLACVYIR